MFPEMQLWLRVLLAVGVAFLYGRDVHEFRGASTWRGWVD